MKNLIRILLLFIAVCTIRVDAKELVNIKSISLIEKSDSVEETKNPDFKKYDLNVGLTFINVNDYVKYKVTIENNDNVDYQINIDNSDKHLSYSLNNNTLKSKSVSSYELTVKYNKSISKSELDKQLTSKSVIRLDKKIQNPNTNSVYLVLIFLLIFSITLFILTKNKMIVVPLMVCVIAIPMIVNAKNLIMTINTEYKILSTDGLRFNNKVLDYNFIKNYKKDYENVNGFIIDSGKLIFELSDNGADVKMPFTVKYGNNYVIDFGVRTTFSIDQDTETGASKVVVGECPSNPESFSYISMGSNGIKNDPITLDGKTLSYLAESYTPSIKFCDKYNSLMKIYSTYELDNYDIEWNNDIDELTNMCKNPGNRRLDTVVMLIRTYYMINNRDELCPSLIKYLESLDPEEAEKYVDLARKSSSGYYTLYDW